jgi:hypothetical protein
LSRGSRRILRQAPGAACLLLVACVSSRPVGDRAPGTHPAPVQAGAADASYDWHGLLVAPFGTLLKESPIALHEVLLFHDESHGGAEAGKDCYAIDGAPPRFVGRQPDEYLLCFDHDRLNRIDASVRLAADDAAQVFARACALWLKNSAPSSEMGNICEGREDGIAWSARLEQVPGEATVPLALTLSNAAERDTAERDAVDAVPREK